MKLSEKAVIYIRLLDEGIPVARPTLGEMIGDSIYRIFPTENYDLEDEHWEFIPGTIVRCERRIGPKGQESLVAVESAEL